MTLISGKTQLHELASEAVPKARATAHAARPGKPLSWEWLKIARSEHEKIAAALHDTASQSIGAALIDLQVLKVAATEQETLDAAVAALRQAAQELRALSAAQHAKTLESAGLARSVENYVRHFTGLGFSSLGEMRSVVLDYESDLFLYRFIAQLIVIMRDAAAHFALGFSQTPSDASVQLAFTGDFSDSNAMKAALEHAEKYRGIFGILGLELVVDPPGAAGDALEIELRFAHSAKLAE